MDQATKDGLNIAFNEASLLGIEVAADIALAGITLSVLTLPDDTNGPPADPRISVSLDGVTRIAASLRNGRWDDTSAKAESFEIGKLFPIVASFGFQPVYGWDFFDRHEDFKTWNQRLSLDLELSNKKVSNSITLFQEATDRHLDVRIWFAELDLYDPDGNELNVSDVIEGGKRWWDAIAKKDPRIQHAGIVASKDE